MLVDFRYDGEAASQVKAVRGLLGSLTVCAVSELWDSFSSCEVASHLQGSLTSLKAIAQLWDYLISFDNTTPVFRLPQTGEDA